MSLDDLLQALAAQVPPGAGPIGLLSGDEFQPHATAFDRALIDSAGPRVALILCADHAAASQSARFARAHLEPLGAEIVTANLMHDDTDPAAVDIVYIAGGSPNELLGCLKGPRWDAIKDRWRAGAALAGSSAGAMALCSHSLVPREGDKVPTTWTAGAGPLHGVGLAVHASSRPREWIDDVAHNAPVPLLAIDDHAGIIFSREGARIVGEGSAWIGGA